MELFIKKHCHLSLKSRSELPEMYRALRIDYPKFFKMDNLSKLGFLASEILFKDETVRFTPREDIALIGFNSSSSLDTDRNYQATIRDADNYFPSPSVFVYTLPNMVAGEIAIRNRFYCETFFYICENFDVGETANKIRLSFTDSVIRSVLAFWIEYTEETKEVFMIWVDKEKNKLPFSEEQLSILYNK
ncbi:MAG: hypothetical protein LBB73_03555 [Dysgonamonadaceae bacterium]|jgi:3-oxoacyl-[acyl-carrier-protein] synthase-1|nr:hypothetical protein [Dysgonamonadaceae bacterium]